MKDYEGVRAAYGTPEHVLKLDDAQIVPKSGMKKWILFRKAFLGIVAIIILASLLLGENLYDALSFPVKLLLIAAAASLLFLNTDERVPVPMEIWFYKDFLVLYHEQHYHNKKHIRLEYDRMWYRDIKQCQYRESVQRINFYGIAEGIWYEYDKDGQVSEKPVYNKTTDSIRYLYTMFADGPGIVREIENHTPLKVERG